MISYNMKIHLLSDLCVSDGGVYNSVLDTDICKDVNGFPYIPAKRIKGCLKESAMELSDWGESINIKRLFGKKGEKKNSGILRISDAVLADALQYADEIKSGEAIYHPQHIADLYSYVRTQTAIDRETGTAKENSLRTMRVANKGLNFSSEISIDENEISTDEDIFEIMSDICDNFTHLGIARTRGFGEVSVSIEKNENKTDHTIKPEYEEADADILEYELFLEEPVICKSAAGSIEDSNDYIEGSKVLGIIAGRYRNKYQKEITTLLSKGAMQFSNAYIAINHQRFTEVPASIYSIKNHTETYIQKIYDSDNEAAKDSGGKPRQLNQMKHAYVCIDKDGNLQKAEVKLEKRYHHRRPEDKSIGRAAKEESSDSEFYQISSISKGQVFKGFIKGNTEQIKTVKELLCADRICYIGYGSSAEYGKVTIGSIKTLKDAKKTNTSDRILLTLISPAIVYNEKAMYSGKVEDLTDEMLSELGITEAYSIEQRYVKYTFVGGYNVTWNQRKPLIQAFDKGTAVLLKFAEPIEIRCSDHEFLGERRVEGLGEFKVEGIDLPQEKAEYSIAIKDKQNRSSDPVDLTQNPLAAKICQNLFDEYFRGFCISEIGELATDSNKPTVSNMMQMCKENTDLDKVKKAVEERYGKKNGENKQKKYDNASEILNKFEKTFTKALKKFTEQYHVSNYECKDTVKVELLNAMLQQIKYAIRNPVKAGKENING